MRFWFTNTLYCLIFVAMLSYITTKGAIASGYNWQWHEALPYFFTIDAHGSITGFGPLITKGLTATLRISFIALLATFTLGLVVAALRIVGGPIAKTVCLVYINTFRNTPLMVQLILMYLLVPTEWNVSAEWVAIITLTLFEGAYMAEIFRAGILSIPVGQWEAALSLGLPYRTCWTRIILPQALRTALPATLNQSVSLIKDSSLVSIIAVSELSQLTNLAVSDSFLSFEIWLPVAGIYLTLALALTALARWLNTRLTLGTLANTPY